MEKSSQNRICTSMTLLLFLPVPGAGDRPVCVVVVCDAHVLVEVNATDPHDDVMQAVGPSKYDVHIIFIILDTFPTPTGTAYTGCPEQELELAGSEDHQDYGNNFFKKISLAL